MAEDFVAHGERTRRMALRSVAVLMARMGRGFDHSSPALRLADLARVGLRDGRKVISPEEMRQMLHDKFKNPMLGIYGGHLLLTRRRGIDHELVETVMGNLTELLGPHPDVLALHLRPGSETPPKALSLAKPPMLKNSWDLILHGAQRRNSLVPRESPSDLLADGMLTAAPWLLRRIPEVTAAESVEQLSFSASKRALTNMASALRSEDVAEVVRAISVEREIFSPLERSILAATRSVAASEQLLKVKDRPSEIRTSAVLEEIDAPPSAIARSTLSALRKLDQRGVDVGTLGMDLDVKKLI